MPPYIPSRNETPPRAPPPRCREPDDLGDPFKGVFKLVRLLVDIGEAIATAICERSERLEEQRIERLQREWLARPSDDVVDRKPTAIQNIEGSRGPGWLKRIANSVLLRSKPVQRYVNSQIREWCLAIRLICSPLLRLRRKLFPKIED